MTKLYDLAWSLVMTTKAIHLYGLRDAKIHVDRLLQKERLNYWRLTGKHPDAESKMREDKDFS